MSEVPLLDDLREWRAWIERRKGQRDQAVESLAQAEGRVAALKAEALDLEEAQRILQLVAVQTQATLEFHISELGDLALSAVFDDPYRLILEFVDRRGRSETDIRFQRGDDEDSRIQPLTAAGGGAVDVAAFALRGAVLTLGRPEPMRLLALDEPFRFVSVDLLDRASALLAELAEGFGFQFVAVSHVRTLIEAADRKFVVSAGETGSVVTTEE